MAREGQLVPLCALGETLRPEVIESDKGASISIGQLAHQRGEANTGSLQISSPNKLYGKAYCVDSHASLPVLGLAVDTVNRTNNLCDGVACEFITEHVDTNLFVRIIKSPNRSGNALHR